MPGTLEAPFVPTPRTVVRRMLEVADVRPGNVLYDLGAGDGRILEAAATEFQARAIGVELHPARAQLSRRRIRELDDTATVIHGSFYDVNLSRADVVAMYLLPSVNYKIRPKLELELKNGARVVSHDFAVPGWIPSRIETVRDSSGRHAVYLYRMPQGHSRS